MTANSLWDYGLRLWAEPEVEPCCLQLQDDYQVPVSLLLLGCWLGARGCAPDLACAARCRALAEQFEQRYLRPLRQRRRRLAGEPQLAGLKRLLQQLELEGERRLLGRLTALTAGLDDRLGRHQAEAWLLLLQPQAASCSGLQQGMQALLAAVETATGRTGRVD